MNNPDRLYQVALTRVPNIGAVQARLLVERFGDAHSVFRAKKKDIAAVEGIGEIKAACIRSFNDFDIAEKELAFTEKHHIRILFLTDKDYPQRLLHCYDPPTVLYYRGNTELNHPRIISMIGTRNNTEYGKEVTETLVQDLVAQQVLVVSGLAFGIDAIAHRAAISNGLPTTGVLAHGLDKIYPPQHKQLAKDILLNGGLLTEFPRDTSPDKHNFPKRNRIVAGMSDATIVVETAAKGGSIITAELAYSYNRDVFAIPGKITDSKSSGCLQLVRQNKAVLLTDAAQLVQAMGWEERTVPKPRKPKELFIDLNDDEKTIVGILKDKDSVHIDELYLKSALSSSTVAAAILNLELQNVIASLPGKLYKLN